MKNILRKTIFILALSAGTVGMAYAQSSHSVAQLGYSNPPLIQTSQAAEFFTPASTQSSWGECIRDGAFCTAAAGLAEAACLANLEAPTPATVAACVLAIDKARNYCDTAKRSCKKSKQTAAVDKDNSEFMLAGFDSNQAAFIKAEYNEYHRLHHVTLMELHAASTLRSLIHLSKQTKAWQIRGSIWTHLHNSNKSMLAHIKAVRSGAKDWEKRGIDQWLLQGRYFNY